MSEGNLTSLGDLAQYFHELASRTHNPPLSGIRTKASQIALQVTAKVPRGKRLVSDEHFQEAAQLVFALAMQADSRRTDAQELDRWVEHVVSEVMNYCSV